MVNGVNGVCVAHIVADGITAACVSKQNASRLVSDCRGSDSGLTSNFQLQCNLWRQFTDLVQLIIEAPPACSEKSARVVSAAASGVRR